MGACVQHSPFPVVWVWSTISKLLITVCFWIFLIILTKQNKSILTVHLNLHYRNKELLFVSQRCRSCKLVFYHYCTIIINILYYNLINNNSSKKENLWKCWYDMIWYDMIQPFGRCRPGVGKSSSSFPALAQTTYYTYNLTMTTVTEVFSCSAAHCRLLLWC